MKFKQRLKQEFEKTKPTDWFKAAAILVIIFCGVKIFMLFYLDFVMTLILTAAFLEEHGKTEFTKQLPLIVKWSIIYLKGLIIGIVALSLIRLKEKIKTKPGEK